jgi:hypothetical protein
VTQPIDIDETKLPQPFHEIDGILAVLIDRIKSYLHLLIGNDTEK